MNEDVRVENRKLTRQLWLMAAGAFGFGFALIPLYDVMCDITGYGNRASLREASAEVETAATDRRVTVEMISATPTFGSWEFHPMAASIVVEPGKLYETKFYAKNLQEQAVTAQAIPSIAPSQATAVLPQDRMLLLHAAAFRGT